MEREKERTASQQRAIALQQKEIAHGKLKLELFQRRLVLFERAWSLLSWATRMGTDNAYRTELNKQQAELQNLLPEALFLFGQDTYEYLRTVQGKIIEHEARMTAARANNDVMRPEHIDPDHAYALWVGEQALTGVRDKFAPYLDFSKWQ